ncbi:MAG: VapC toxin family PIN domain ribonuclease [Polaromonas sp.]|nr:VapC toxin family PIN domain ribonuclease [Polaromonas sp.]
MRAILDVSVLIALLDTQHLHHAGVTRWFANNAASGWASCPLTQNGCIRILSQPAYLNSTAAAVVADILIDATADASHQFWPDSFSLLESGALNWDRLLSGRHLTAVYLLALAVRNKGRLATLDQGIPLSAVPGALPEHLIVLSNKAP